MDRSPASPSDGRFEALERAYERAAQATGEVVYPLQVAGRRVDLRFAGTALVSSVTPAFAHLRAVSGVAEHTFFVADVESTHVSPLEDRLAAAPFPAPAANQPRSDTRCAYIPTSETLHALDPNGRRGFFWPQSARVFKPWDTAAPLRLLLSWWAESLGAQLAHGAVVGFGDDGILLAGRGGSGKSTAALACVEQGLTTLGDDYVWIEPGHPARAFSLYCTVKVDRRSLRVHFPGLAAYARGNEGEKATLFLADAPKVRWAPSLAVCAIAALRIGNGAKPTVRRASLVEVLMALAPSSLLQLPGLTPTGLERLSGVVRRSRAVTFEAGSDYRANADALARLLDELSEDAPAVARSDVYARKRP